MAAAGGGGGGGGGQQDDDDKTRKRDEEWGTTGQNLPLPQLKNAGPCPYVKVLYDAARYVEFKDDKVASSAVGYTGEIQNLSPRPATTRATSRSTCRRRCCSTSGAAPGAGATT